eukprot:IDg2533t1
MPGCLRCHARHLATELTADSYLVTAGCTDSTTSIPLLQFPWRRQNKTSSKLNTISDSPALTPCSHSYSPALATFPAHPKRCSTGRASGRARRKPPSHD